MRSVNKRNLTVALAYTVPLMTRIVFFLQFICTTMDEIETRITDFKQLCRLCLHEKGVLIDIFDSAEENHSSDIYQKIKACATIDLCKDDGLPTRICSPCLSSLNAAFEFRIQCENADKTLHEIYHLLVSDQEIYDRKKEKKIFFVKNDVESSVEENKKLAAIQCAGFNQVLVIKRQDREAFEEVDDNDSYCNEKEARTEVEDSVYVVNGFQNNTELSDNIIIDEIINVSEEGIPSSDSYSSQMFHNKEIIKSSEDSTLELLEKNQETNVICLEVETKRSKGTQEAKRSACPFCHKVLTRVNEHIRLLHRNKVYVCKKNDCGAEFLTLKNLQSHQLKCFNMEKPYKCLRCFKEFYRKCNYKAHIVRHSNKKAFQCQLCDKAFVDSTGLRRHFLKHHEPQQETFTSGCCGKKFKTKEGLKQHIQKGICGVRIFPVSINNIISS